MKIKLIHTFVFLFVFSVVCSQNFTPLRIASDSKMASEFNKQKVKVLFSSEIKEGHISINLETINNTVKGTYYYQLYLIDQRPNIEIKNTKTLYNWIVDKFDFIDLSFPMKDDDIDFGGTFIEFNPDYLTRQDFSLGLLKFKDESIGHEKYSLNFDNVSPNTEIKIAYVFLIATAKKNEIVGLTEPVECIIPQEIIKQLLMHEGAKVNQQAEIREPEAQVEKKPEKDLVKDYQHKVNDIIAPFQHLGSYHNSWNDYDLYKKYADGNYNQRIKDLIAEINTSLNDPMYDSKRNELNRELEKYMDKKNTVDANIEKLRPKEVNKCEEYESSYNSIINSLGITSAEISGFEKKVLPKISELENDLAGCKEEQNCKARVTSAFEKEEWQKQLNKYYDRINAQRGNINSLKNKPDYKTCNLSAATVSNKINATEKKLDQLEKAILDFRVKIEGSLTDLTIHKLAVEKFTPNIDLLVEQFHDIKQLYLNMDDEFFANGSLEISQIEDLEYGSDLLGQMSGRIDGIVTKAAKFYKINDAQSSKFSEDLFRQQTGVDFNANDINQLKSNIDDLIIEAKGEVRGNLAIFIILAIVALSLTVFLYLKFRN